MEFRWVWANPLRLMKVSSEFVGQKSQNYMKFVIVQQDIEFWEFGLFHKESIVFEVVKFIEFCCRYKETKNSREE